MKPIIQTKLSTPDGSISGNCFRACLASIMELDINSIPFFEDMEREWHIPFFKFLDDNGYEFEGTGHKIEKLKDYSGVDGYVIVGGKSPRSYVTRGHAVVYKDGELVHDPHPEGGGLLEIRDYYMIKRKDRV